jgi:hypothetical protein
MSATNAETAIIYGQTQTHKGHEFAVWSYLDDPNPEKSTMRFAFQVEGVTVDGLPDRAEAIRKARERIDSSARGAGRGNASNGCSPDDARSSGMSCQSERLFSAYRATI